MPTEIEEEYKGFTVFIEKNPDRYRGGYKWSISRWSEEESCFFQEDSDLAFSMKSARNEAKDAVNEYIANKGELKAGN